MKKTILILSLLASSQLFSQKVDSIAFHLYTDSLKKGVHNYINVDGKMGKGNWMPMSAKEISFTSSVGHFEGCDLVIPATYTGESVVVNASLKSNPAIYIKTTIWMKIKPDPDRLPTLDELDKKNTKPDSGSKKNKSSKNK
ncbi:MAG: hypothetical protein E6H07_19165 [Bacteroidetes bacterium]|nr:MAG: hypothetical protein E6H07_19165 [Bacteroidota bacterium]